MRLRSRSAPAVALSLVLAGCTTTADIIADGDQLRRDKHLDQALERYREAQERADIGGSEKVQVARARGEIYLEKGDLNNAEQSFRRMPESSGTRAHLLARVALAKGDRATAEALDRDALAKGEPVGKSLAELVGGEAATPAQLLEASAILARAGGDAEQAKATETVARAWESAARGETPAPLLARVEAVAGSAPKYASIELVRCDLLLRIQSPRAQDAFAALADFVPRPSAAFLEKVSAIYAAGAAQSGNLTDLETALKGLPKDAAAARRAELARGFEMSGDLKGALEVWKRTVDAGGPPAARAECEIARLEELRGRHAAAVVAFDRARAEKDPDVETRAILALARARTSDPLGARAAFQAALAVTTLDPEVRSASSRTLRSAQLLAQALDLVAAGHVTDGRPVASGHVAASELDSRQEATALAQASVSAAPESKPASDVLAVLGPWSAAQDPSDAAPALAKGLLQITATGATRAALVRAAVARLAAAALFDDAVAPVSTPEDRESVASALDTLGPDALLGLVAQARVFEAGKLFAALKSKDLVAQVPNLAARVRTDSAFGALWAEEPVVAALGAPDPLARRAPYVCRLVLADGESFGVVRVVQVTETGLDVVLPGESNALHVNQDRIGRLSIRCLGEGDFEHAARALHETREDRP